MRWQLRWLQAVGGCSISKSPAFAPFRIRSTYDAAVLRDLKKLAAKVVKEESEKTPMARKVHASFTKFQALVGPWDHIAEGAYHQFVAM